jgi:hypothetical protein
LEAALIDGTAPHASTMAQRPADKLVLNKGGGSGTGKRKHANLKNLKNGHPPLVGPFLNRLALLSKNLAGYRIP